MKQKTGEMRRRLGGRVREGQTHRQCRPATGFPSRGSASPVVEALGKPRYSRGYAERVLRRHRRGVRTAIPRTPSVGVVVSTAGSVCERRRSPVEPGSRAALSRTAIGTRSTCAGGRTRRGRHLAAFTRSQPDRRALSNGARKGGGAATVPGLSRSRPASEDLWRLPQAMGGVDGNPATLFRQPRGTRTAHACATHC